MGRFVSSGERPLFMPLFAPYESYLVISDLYGPANGHDQAFHDQKSDRSASVLSSDRYGLFFGMKPAQCITAVFCTFSGWIRRQAFLLLVAKAAVDDGKDSNNGFTDFAALDKLVE